MGLILLVWSVVGVVSLVGYVWLCAVAFKRHAGWGVAVLLLSPIAAIVYAVKHWQESRKPFLIYAGSCVAIVVLALGAFATVGGFRMLDMAARTSAGEEITGEEAMRFVGEQMQRMQESGVLSPEEEAELRRMQETFREMQQDAPAAAGETPATARGPSPRGIDAASSAAPSASPSRRSSIAREAATAAPALPGKPAPPGYKRVSPVEADRYVGHTVRVVNKDGAEHKGRLAEVGREMLLVERRLTSGTVWFEVDRDDVDSLLVAYR